MSEAAVRDIYERTIKALPAAQRLALAALILQGIPPESVLDYGEHWSEEDYHDFSRAGWDQVDAASEEEGHG